LPLSLSSSPWFKSVILACALLAGGCDRQSEAPAQPGEAGSANKGAGKLDRASAGQALPDLSFPDPAGNQLALASLTGKPVLINLWATWCAPCVAELPTLAKLANRADLDLKVVTVSQDIGDPARVQAFLDERGLAQLPAWIDAKGDLPAHYKLQTLPATVLYDAAGKEVWRYSGERDWLDAESMKLLAEAGALGPT
jgi:thiol-disulfide isomerase/thioredoxin